MLLLLLLRVLRLGSSARSLGWFRNRNRLIRRSGTGGIGCLLVRYLREL